MRFFLVAASLFITQMSYSLSFEPVQQITMKAPSCESLNPYAEALAQWSGNLQQPGVSFPECFCSSKSCQMDVAPISPHFVRQLTQYEQGYSAMSSAHNGPNCFNAALNATGTLPNITFTHPYEMSFVLKSSLCRERTLEEPLQSGDVLVVRHQADPLFEIHAGIYIYNDLSFSKYGQNKMMPYSYGTDVERSYGVKNENCRHIYGTPKPGDECYQQPYVNYYSCTPLYSFISRLSRQPQGLHKTAQRLYAETSRLSLRISNIAFKGTRFEPDALKSLQEALQSLYQESEIALQQTDLRGQNRELVKLMRHHLFSLYEQTRIIAKDTKLLELTTPLLPRP